VAEVRNNSGQAERIFVFGTQYVHELICMAVNTDVPDPYQPSNCFDPDDEHYFYHQDANYNVVALTDKTGRPVEHCEYAPYGQARIHRGRIFEDSDQAYWTVADRSPSATPFTYTGRFLDDESGLMHYRGRIYNPPLARFNQQDPMGALATVPTELTDRGAAFSPVYAIPGTQDEYHDGLNFYQYVASRPLILTDPTGQFTYAESLAVSAITAGLAGMCIDSNSIMAAWGSSGLSRQQVVGMYAVSFVGNAFAGSSRPLRNSLFV